jgi:O-succinylbenzoate synthase
MRIESIELRTIHLPLVRPFRTSFGTQNEREVLLVRMHTHEGVTGWAECVALSEPVYSPEYVTGAIDVITRFLAPALLGDADLRAEEVKERLRPYLGHQMAKASLESALLDAQLRYEGQSLGGYLGAERERVDCGVSVGIASSLDRLLEEVSSYIDAGYRRIKLKIEPGWDLEPVGLIRSTWPHIPLQVDANQAYGRGDIEHLAQLDRFDLLLNEQPFDEHDLLAHAMLAAASETPVCLDESITSFQTARDAIAMKATTVINIKPGRVGGYLESVRIHDLCVEAGLPVWCGGMLETGIGRAANVALAALPGFTLPGDTSASSRYYLRDITDPFEMIDGQLAVPTGTGIGVEPHMEFLDSITTWRTTLA